MWKMGWGSGKHWSGCFCRHFSSHGAKCFIHLPKIYHSRTCIFHEHAHQCHSVIFVVLNFSFSYILVYMLNKQFYPSLKIHSLKQCDLSL